MKPILIKFFYIAVAVFLLSDLVYSYKQYNHTAVDGDFPLIVLGQNGYDKVLNDPLGLSALQGESYPGTNRYTSHKIMSVYFKYVPLFFQNFISPVDSLYLSITLAKFFVHVALLLLFGYYVSVWLKWAKWKSYLITTAIITPFFIGGNTYMEHLAVMDPCVTYIMFYPLPLAALLAFYLPFYNYYITGNISKSPVFICLWIVFAFAIVLFGPLPAALLLTTIPIFVLFLIVASYRKQVVNTPSLLNAVKGLNKTMLLLLCVTFVFALYSFYIGTKNSENADPMELKERFVLLFKGIKEVFFNREHGVMYVFAATIFNVIMLGLLYGRQHRHYLYLVCGLCLFSAIYILLLPLGGYRYYRPLMLRRDTMLPVLFVMFFVVTTSGLLLLRNCPGKFKLYPLAFFIVVGFHFTVTDRQMPEFYSKENEKVLMAQAAASKENCVLLNRLTPIASWAYNANCEDSEPVANLLYYYHITPRKIYVRYMDHYEEPK